MTALEIALGDSPPPAVAALPPRAQDDLVACIEEAKQHQAAILKQARMSTLELLPSFLRSTVARLLAQ
ncbi:hypothetical protein ACIRRA_41750 [Nocardia sp. NPDC101769]|uniref:hypothetical protein n=1 Tax=Nocardia sp. NPDC101769 TaxID=3364333 RepID=UPI0038095AF8